MLEETRPAPREAIRADTAFVMTNLLRGVVQRGTAAAANVLDWPLAGKTGTVDDYTDAWFVGFDPHITVGVWVGYDEKKPIGNGETGATTALPIWIDFMKTYIDAARRSREAAGLRAARQHHLPRRRSLDRRSRSRCRRLHQRSVHLRHAAGNRRRNRAGGARHVDRSAPSARLQTRRLLVVVRRGRAERARRLLHQIGLDERIDVAVEDAVDVADLVAWCGGP